MRQGYWLFSLMVVVRITVQASHSFEQQLALAIHQAPGTVCYSPASVRGVLALVAVGARGQTAVECERVFGGPRHLDIEQLAHNGDCVLQGVNVAWIAANYPVLPSYAQALKQFGASIHQINFGQSVVACKHINDFIAQQTGQMIKQLLVPHQVPVDTKLILANTLYFKGSWLAAFDVQETKDAPFMMHPHRSVMVPMMHRRGTYQYAESEHAQVVCLPYAGQQLGMIVAVPKTTMTAGEQWFLTKLFDESLSGQWLDRWALQDRLTDLMMPRFTVCGSLQSMRAVLQLVGLRTVFGSRADFSGISGYRDVCLDDVVHKVVVEVNEQGTRAAAASAAIMRNVSCYEPESVCMHVDRPFLFAIVHKESGQVLFVGRVVNPLLEENA